MHHYYMGNLLLFGVLARIKDFRAGDVGLSTQSAEKIRRRMKEQLTEVMQTGQKAIGK